MMHHGDGNTPVSLERQYRDSSDDPVVLVSIFETDPADHEVFTAAWAAEAAAVKGQPGWISTNLLQGIEGSTLFVEYAVYETVRACAAAHDRPEVQLLSQRRSVTTTTRAGLFRHVAVPGVCVDRC